MKKQKEFNTISPGANIMLTAGMFIFSMFCLLPVALLYIVSFSTEASVANKGYSFLPEGLTLEAYAVLFRSFGAIANAYGVSIIVTLVGTTLGLAIMTMFSYAITQEDFKYRKGLTLFALFTMMFNGGLVSTYLINTQLYNLSNTIWALILPYMVAAYYIIIIRTFFTQTIPKSVIESARIDGASEMQVFLRIILPLSKPVLATIGLFLVVTYWNDWYLGLLYITEDHLVSIQYSLMKIQSSMDFIRNSAYLQSTDMASDFMKNYPAETSRMAMLTVVITPVVFAYPFFQRYFVSGLTIGSVKG